MEHASTADDDWLDLADAITLLRDQIVEAQDRIAGPQGVADKGVRFGLGEITLELGMELARTRGGTAGCALPSWVLVWTWAASARGPTQPPIR